MKAKLIIAIDGPAGAGKSTIAKLLAKKLNYIYIDSGAMYRALTWKAMRLKIALDDAQELVILAKNTKFYFRQQKKKIQLFMDGKPVTRKIRSPQVTKNISHIADNAQIRVIMVELQRQAGQDGGVIMEGRDIGTKVFPKADFKFFLDASVRERARRRYEEFKAQGKEIIFSDIFKDIKTRDRKDKKRKVSPLIKAPDAINIDSSDLEPPEVVDKILYIVKARRSEI